MKIGVQRAVQRDVTLYIGKISVATLLEKCVITEWDPNLGWDLSHQGYQRAPVEKHYKRIAQFLAMGDPLLPTAALLSAREADYGQLSFEVVPGTEFGYIDVPDGRQLFIVDYQHRFRAFRTAIQEMKKEALRDFQVPFVLMANADRYEEMRQFYLINDKQRRVDTDLALALMMTMAGAAVPAELANLAGPGKRYRIRATRLTFRIAAQPTGCWSGRIAEPNNPRPTDVASLKSFTDSLRPVISNRSPVHSRSDDELVRIISDYWEGIKLVMPNAFRSPQGFAIQKTPGLFAMHRVAAKKVFSICSLDRDFSPQHVAQILQPAVVDYLNDSFFKTGGRVGAYGGAGGQKALAQEIIAKL
ncbi:MAG: DGQHR domain-containing protein [Chloroflexi bacterium]|nr:DGQHR domain-containing protein [Chloroflexota bacterium]